MNDFAAEQTVESKKLARSLFSALSGLYSESAREADGWETLYKGILQPAIRLVNAMRVSDTNYLMVSYLFAKASNEQYAIFRNEIQHYELVESTTHKIIRPDSILKVADDGRIGEEMFVVSPALLRSQKDGNGTVILCKPTILAKLDAPMGKRERKTKAMGGWAPSWLSGDAEVE